jgi:hypothetical protein
MKVRTLFSRVLALLLVSVAAPADPVTFDFTGSVSYTTGQFLTSLNNSTNVVGTFTFDFSFANPQFTTGSVGTAAPWSVSAAGGLVGGGPLPLGNLFSTTFKIGTFSYSTQPPQQKLNSSTIAGSNGNLTANVQNEPVGPYFNEEASFTSTAGYARSGLPLPFSGNGKGNGFIVVTDNQGALSSINFNLTSLTRAPEIESGSAAGALTLLLSSLAVLRARYRGKS